MTGQKPLHPMFLAFIALMMVLGGLMPMLAAFDIGPLNSGDINGPPWLGVVAGGVFMAGGVALLFGKRMGKGTGFVFFYLVYAAFAAIGNWIAFGPGPRECTIVAMGFLFDSASIYNEIACRAGFGIGAGVMDGIMLILTGSGLAKVAGENALSRLMDKLGLAVLLIALSPILVPCLAILVGKSLLEGYFTYRRTGQWPRNEAFIARMKARRADQ